MDYKWTERLQEEGRRGLCDRSRAPHHGPHRINPELAEPLCLANAMGGQHRGLEETDDGVWNSHFNTVQPATLDEKDHIIRG